MQAIQKSKELKTTNPINKNNTIDPQSLYDLIKKKHHNN
jgi:hypothetical protein